MSSSQLPTVPNPDLELVNGVPMVNSLKVAESFGRLHKDVLEAIRKLLPDLPPEFNERNFRPVEYLDGKGEKRPAFNLTRDGFTLLAMGFTGKQALAWKLRYIEAFNAMEGRLIAQQKLALADARKEGLEAGVRAVMTLPPERMAKTRKILRYKAMGLQHVEIAKLLDMPRTTVADYVTTARKMGIVE